KGQIDKCRIIEAQGSSKGRTRQSCSRRPAYRRSNRSRDVAAEIKDRKTVASRELTTCQVGIVGPKATWGRAGKRRREGMMRDQGSARGAGWRCPTAVALVVSLPRIGRGGNSDA